jgi:hypothetical protein
MASEIDARSAGIEAAKVVWAALTDKNIANVNPDDPDSLGLVLPNKFVVAYSSWLMAGTPRATGVTGPVSGRSISIDVFVIQDIPRSPCASRSPATSSGRTGTACLS